MIEILILYVLSRHERTLYAIRQEIFELFGAYTKPSIGTMHPALKRLLSEKAVTVKEKFSDGGKKSSYFSITSTGREYFKKMFFANENENPSLFYTHLVVRFAVMGFLELEDRKRFINESLRKLDMYRFEIESKLNDEFLELDYFQRQIMTRTLSEHKAFVEFIKQLKVENDG